MTIAVSQLTALLIPLQNKTWLLPNISVAEIIPFRKPLPINKAPHWCLGKLTWRGVTIPLVSFELLNDETLAAQQPGARIAVFNCLNEAGKLPFFAAVTQGIPRSVKVSVADLTKQDSKVGHAEAMLVTLQDQSVVIPNLDYIEMTIAKAKIS